MSGRAEPLPDAAARRRAVRDFESNLVVLAGAGTGKTSLLVERVLNAIGSGRVEIDRLAAITFTEKAAAELRQRLAEELEHLRAATRGERDTPDGSAASRARAWLEGEARVGPAEIAARCLAALEKLDQAPVLTIHGFSSELLRAHPLEAGVDPDFEVDTGEQAQLLGQAMWEDYVAGELGPQAERPELWSRLLARLPMARVAELARRLGEFDVPEELLRPGLALPTALEIFGPVALERIAEIETLTDRASGMAPSGERFFASVGSALRAFASDGLEAFHRTAARYGLPDTLAKTRPKANKRLTGVSAEEFDDLARRCRDLARELSACDETLTPLIVELLAPFATSIREQLLRRGWVSFDALLALARDLLRDHPAVRAELKRRFGMILVDEFQDTDPLQYEIVLLLGEREDGAATRAHDARLAPGRLFVVGDPKQSIYRFRGADYEAFRHAVERIIEEGGTRLELTANFRSVPGVVAPINALFESPRSVCWSESTYQPAYEPIRAVRPQPDRSARLEVWTLDVPEATRADARRMMEGRLVAEAIERLRDEHRCGYGSFSILFRAFASVPAYLRPLRERGIPFVIDGGKDFIKRPEITQSLAVLRALAQPADPIALLGFLRSPAGGVRDTELAAYAAGGGRWHWRADVDPQKFPRIADRFGLLCRLHDETRDLAADAVVRRVVEQTLLLPLSAAAYEGAQRVANLRKLVAAAGELARDGRLSLEDVVDTLQEGRLAGLEWDSPLADDRADAVRITSIHKMKGLENDWVFLPDLARQDWRSPGIPQPPRVDVARLAGGRRAIALSVAGSGDPASAWHRLEHALHEEAEEIRVLYVGMTRARERLVLIASPTHEPGRWLKALGALGYDHRQPPDDGAALLDGIGLHRRVEPPPRSAVEATDGKPRETAAVRRYEEAVASQIAAAVPPFRSPSAHEEEIEGARQDDEIDSAPRRAGRSRDLGRAAGVVIHRLLERWEPRGLASAEVDRLCGEVARDGGLDPASLLAEVRAIVAAFAGSGLERRLAEIEVVGRELPLLLGADDGAAFRGSIDLLYRDAGDGWVVADYKTDDEEDDSVLRERYAAQLEVYARAVGRALDLAQPPRKELWLLRRGAVLTLEPGPAPPEPRSGPPEQLSLW